MRAAWASSIWATLACAGSAPSPITRMTGTAPGPWMAARLMNQSIHHIDALQWFMGPVDSVQAYTATLAHQMEAEDVGVAVVRFASGALATVEGSTLTWPQNLEGSVAFFGERGSVKIGGTALNRITLWKVAGQLEQESEILTSQRVDPPSVYGYSHREVIRDFAQALLEGAPPGDAWRGGAEVAGPGAGDLRVGAGRAGDQAGSQASGSS